MITPNEIRVRSSSNVQGVIKSVVSLFRDQQYTYCKVVGRGMACELVKEILASMMERHSYHYESTMCKSINKLGKLVDEMHVIISDKGGNKFASS